MWIVGGTDLANNYFEIVNQCLTNDNVFENFKSIDAYVGIVGTPLTSQCPYFLETIEKHPDVIKRYSDFRKNDYIGNPPHHFPELNLSAGTIRYIHSLCRIKEDIGSLDNMIISELGVGYGGLAFMIYTFFKPKAYHLLDVPNVQKFALKYLAKHNMPATDAPPPEEVDLFISEFCLAEFDDTDLYDFYEKYVKKSKSIHLLMNLIDEERKARFITKVKEDFNVTVRPETHGTNFPAYVIVGKK